jgi:hypothetical protein
MALYVSSALSFQAGSLHRRKSAACPKFDMVWLNRSSGEEGGNFLVQMISTCFCYEFYHYSDSSSSPADRTLDGFSFWGKIERSLYTSVKLFLIFAYSFVEVLTDHSNLEA